MSDDKKAITIWFFRSVALRFIIANKSLIRIRCVALRFITANATLTIFFKIQKSKSYDVAEQIFFLYSAMQYHIKYH